MNKCFLAQPSWLLCLRGIWKVVFVLQIILLHWCNFSFTYWAHYVTSLCVSSDSLRPFALATWSSTHPMAQMFCFYKETSWGYDNVVDCGLLRTCISDVDLLVNREEPIGKSQHINSVNDHPLPLHKDTGTCVLSVVGLWSDSEGVDIEV